MFLHGNLPTNVLSLVLGFGSSVQSGEPVPADDRTSVTYQPCYERVIVALHDLDQDGIGEYSLVVLSGEHTGEVVVLSGATNRVLYTISGEKWIDHLGYSIAEIDDLDGDGVSDLVVGSPGGMGSLGIHSGLRTRAGPWFLKSFSGRTGESIAKHDKWWKACPIGDADGDGVSDLLVAAPDDESNSRGRVDLLPLGIGKVSRPIEPPQPKLLKEKLPNQFGLLMSRCDDGFVVACYQDTQRDAMWLIRYSRTGDSVMAVSAFPRGERGPLRALRYIEGQPDREGALIAITEFGKVFSLSPASLAVKFETKGQGNPLRDDSIEPILESVGDLDGDGSTDFLAGPYDTRAFSDEPKELRILSGKDGAHIRNAGMLPSSYASGACIHITSRGDRQLLVTWLTEEEPGVGVQMIRRVSLEKRTVEWEERVDKVVAAQKK